MDIFLKFFSLINILLFKPCLLAFVGNSVFIFTTFMWHRPSIFIEIGDYWWLKLIFGVASPNNNFKVYKAFRPSIVNPTRFWSSVTTPNDLTRFGWLTLLFGAHHHNKWIKGLLKWVNQSSTRLIVNVSPIHQISKTLIACKLRIHQNHR